MKLGFHGATTMSSSLEKDIEISALAGFSGLEVWAEKVDRYLTSHTLDELNALFTTHGIEPLALDALVFIGFRGQEFPLVQQQCWEMCTLAQAIGCPTIAVVPSPLPHHEVAWEEVVQEYVAVLRDLGGIAGSLGVKLAFEALGFGWASVRTPRGAWEIVQKTNLDNIGLAFDAAHFYAGGGLLDELDAINADKIFAFHLDDVEDLPKEAITDSSRILPGEGVIPLDAICAKLKAIGYDGHCSIELFRPEYWEQDPLDVARSARAATVRVLSPHFSLK